MDTRTLVLITVCAGLGYVIGGIPWGVVVARIVRGPDPRTVGSGRTGGANVLRALGPRAAVVAGLLDVLKGVIAVAIAIVLGGNVYAQIVAALAAILGHSRSPFIGFSGGRGVAPGFGGLILIQPLVALTIVPVFAAVLFVSRYSSLASLIASAIAAVATAAMVLVFDQSVAYLVYAAAAAAMIWLFHVDNIQRLLSGQERRIDWRH